MTQYQGTSANGNNKSYNAKTLAEVCGSGYSSRVNDVNHFGDDTHSLELTLRTSTKFNAVQYVNLQRASGFGGIVTL